MFSDNRACNVSLVNVHLSQTVNSAYNQLSHTFRNWKCICTDTNLYIHGFLKENLVMTLT